MVSAEKTVTPKTQGIHVRRQSARVRKRVQSAGLVHPTAAAALHLPTGTVDNPTGANVLAAVLLVRAWALKRRRLVKHINQRMDLVDGKSPTTARKYPRST